MSEKTLKCKNIKVDKKEFHKYKQPTDLKSVNVDQILVSDRFKHSDEGFNYLLVTKAMKLLNRYALSYPKWVDT